MKHVFFFAVVFLACNQSIFAEGEESTDRWDVHFTVPYSDTTVYLLGASYKNMDIKWSTYTGGSSLYRVRFYVNGSQMHYGQYSNWPFYNFYTGQYTLLIKLFYINISGQEVFVKEHSVTLTVHPGYYLYYGNNFDGGAMWIGDPISGNHMYYPTNNGWLYVKWVPPGTVTFTGIDNQTGTDGYNRVWDRWTELRYFNIYSTNTNIEYTTSINQNDWYFSANYNIQPTTPTNFQNTASSGSVQINWSASSGTSIQHYEVERHIIDNGGWVVIGTTTNTSFTDTWFSVTDPRWATHTAEYRIRAKSTTGLYSAYSSIVTVQGISYWGQKKQLAIQQLPTEFSFEQNYPNPFNPTTEISFAVPEPSFVSLSVFNSVGQEIATLVNEHKGIGNYTVTWNASNLPSGVYFYKITAGKFSDTKKMMLTK